MGIYKIHHSIWVKTLKLPLELSRRDLTPTSRERSGLTLPSEDPSPRPRRMLLSLSERVLRTTPTSSTPTPSSSTLLLPSPLSRLSRTTTPSSSSATVEPRKPLSRRPVKNSTRSESAVLTPSSDPMVRRRPTLLSEPTRKPSRLLPESESCEHTHLTLGSSTFRFMPAQAFLRVVAFTASDGRGSTASKQSI